MIFLNPTVLLGLLAAGIPILIHLLNLRKLKKIEFSTLAFLKELQKTKIRKIKLKQWILLALRVLIIIFLVLSFARPTLESVDIAAAASKAKTSSVFMRKKQCVVYTQALFFGFYKTHASYVFVKTQCFYTKA